MRKLFRAGVTLAAATLASGTLVAGLAGTAHAATIPPWETGSPPAVSPNELGGLTFYNSAGQVVTGGNISDNPIAAYVQGNTALQTGGTKADLGGVTPVISSAPGAWTGVQFGGSNYPNSTAPAALAGSTLPLYTGVSGYSLSLLTSSYPNHDTSTTDGYAGIYVVRLQTYNGNTTSTTYDSADISVNSTSGAWTLVYSPQAATTTTLEPPTPATPVTLGTQVTLTAQVADSSAPGTVQFDSGGSPLGTPQTVNNGIATLATNALPVGTDSLTAVFTPTTGAAFAGSTSSPVSFVVNPPTPDATSTTVTAPAGGSNVNEDTSVPLTATVDDTTLSGTPPINAPGFGSVVFYANSTNTTVVSGATTTLGTAAVGTGGQASATYSGGFSSSGPEYVFAVYSSANGNLSYPSYTGSTSPTSLLTVNASSLAVGQNVETTVASGTVTITTPYTRGNPLNLGNATLNGADSELTASAPFGGSANPVTVTDTRTGATGWTASATATDFSGDTIGVNTGKSIDAQDLSLTNISAVQVAGNALSPSAVTPGNVPTSQTTPYLPGAVGTDGLSGGGSAGNGGGFEHTIASISGQSSVGSVSIIGTVNLIAPTSTPAGLYGATLTLTVA